MAATRSDFDRLIAAGVPTLIASYIATLAPAEQARLRLDELVAYMAGELAKVTSLGFRPARSTLIDIVAACETWPGEFGIQMPLTFADAGEYGVSGWEPAPDGPARPPSAASGPVAGGYINLSCAVYGETRSGEATTLTVKLYRVNGNALVFVKSGTLAGLQIAFQVGPFPAGSSHTFVMKAVDAQGRFSYPTAYLTETAVA